MNELRGERLLDVLGEQVHAKVFMVREHTHVIDGDGTYWCIPEGARLIALSPLQEDSREHVERLAFALGEVGAMVPSPPVQMRAAFRRFDIRAGDPQADDDDLPF